VSDLQSSSDYHAKGLMSANERIHELKRIIRELRVDGQSTEVTREEVYSAQDLCYRLYSEEVADIMAAKLGVTRQQIREALDSAIRWKPENHKTFRAAGPNPAV